MARSPHLPYDSAELWRISVTGWRHLTADFSSSGVRFLSGLLSAWRPAGWEETAVYVRRVVSPCHVSSDPCLDSAADAQLPTAQCPAKRIHFRHSEYAWVTLSGKLPEIQKDRDSARREWDTQVSRYGTILSVRRSGQVWRELGPSSHSGTGAARRAC